MKKQSQNTFTHLSDVHVKSLTTVVNETLAVGSSQPKAFSTVDLWNIQRRSRTIMQRRSFI